MSTLQVTNIKKTGETASRNVSGVAAAWVNFNGTGTVAIRDSANVASLTDNGTGDYTVNLTNSMNGTDSTHGGMAGSHINNLINISQNRNTYPPTASSSRYETTYDNLDRWDSAFVGTQQFGDLA